MKGMAVIKENPFESPAVPMRGKIVWADRKQLLTYLTSLLEKKPEKWTDLLVLLGNYGSGKTHTLEYARVLCEEKKIPSALLPNPGSSFVDTMVKVVESIGVESLVTSCRDLLERDKEVVITQIQQNKKGQLGPESLSTDRLIRYLFPRMDLNLAMILSQLLNNRNVDLCKGWLLGRTLTKAEIARLNVSSAIDSDDEAVPVLSNVVQVLVARFGSFILLIDEMEDIGNMSKSGAVAFAKALRRFIDENVGGLKLILAFTGEAFTQFLRGTGSFQGKRYPALTERLKPTIELTNFTPDETELFISDFISSVYGGPSEKVIAHKTYREIQKRTNGNPRQIVFLCRDLFAEAIASNDFPIEL